MNYRKLFDLCVYVTLVFYIPYKVTNKWIMLGNIILVWYVNYVWIHRHFKKSKDPELLKKYPAFMRNDMHTWMTFWGIPNFLTAIPRLIIGFGLLTIYGILTKIIFLGANTEKVDPTRRWMIKKIGEFICRGILSVSGVHEIDVQRVEDCGYKKWLGPDWKPQWDGSGTLVANHCCAWMDVLVLMVKIYPAFVAKKSVKNYPWIGLIATAMDSLFLDRVGSAEDKQKSMRAIEERQQQNETIGRPPLLVFPEGATTNGDYLIKFKKGPFSGLNSVQPVIIKYKTPNGFNPQSCTISTFAQFFLFMHSPWYTIELKVYPVFKPNEYFWKNHWNESLGEKKWETYVRVVREHIMAPEGKFKLSDLSAEDKIQFKTLYRGKKVID